MIVHASVVRQNLRLEPSPTAEFTEPVVESFRRITVKPVRAVICSHAHPDHIGGVRAFGPWERVHSGGVESIALDEPSGHLAQDSGLLAAVLAHRASYAVYGCAR
ncbi:MAG: MBL fold metallo-hydrolase [bacterium]|nr:MBL fold metallo-hydrolase [bacterium]